MSDLDELLDDDDLTEEELVALIRRRRQRRGQQLAKSDTGRMARPEDVNGIPFPSAANSARQSGSFLEEKESWAKVERTMQGGAYADGGATAGGIFGDGAIILDDFDAQSNVRGAPVLQAHSNERLVQLLERAERRDLEREERLRQLENMERARLQDAPPARERRLGWSSKKKST